MINRQTRRSFIGMLGGAGLAGMLPPGIAFAKGVEDRYLLLVILRGALDGLAAVVPYHESKLKDWRRILVPPEPGKEDGALALGVEGFAFHPSLTFMHSPARPSA